MKAIFSVLISGFVGGMLYAQTPVVPTPSQTDQIIIDANGNNKADPGDKIRYKVTIQNTGTGNATGTQLNVTPDARTTLDGASFRTSPIAFADAYTCTGNVPISVPAASGLKANDFDDNIAGLTVVAGTFGTTQSGSVTITADGSFTYTPPPFGFTGVDNFTYTLEDGNEVAGVAATDAGTVTITVSNLIWFIDNSAGPGGDGRRNTPFNSLSSFNASSSVAGDVVYIEHTGTNYVGGILLTINERLFGEGHTGGANLADVLPFTLAPHSVALPAINGSRPVITNSGGDGISLNAGNTIRGVNVGNCSDFAIDDNGNVGTLTISEVDINNTTGGAFQTDAGGTLAVTLGSVACTGGSRGIYLNATGGTFTVTGATTCTNPTNQGIRITSTSTNVSFAAITIGGTISGSEVMELSGNSGTFNAGGTTTINAPGGSLINSLLIAGGTGSITFANMDINGRRGTGILVVGGSRNITTGAVDIDNSNGSTSVALNVQLATGGTISFGATAINTNGSSSTCISIDDSGATTTFASGSAVVNGTGYGFGVNQGAGNVTYNGSVSSTAGSCVFIQNRTGGTVNLTGSITSNSSNTGIIALNNTGGTINFSGTNKSITASSAPAVSLASNTGATINFTNGGLVISTTSGTGFNATGGGTVTVQGTGNTISSTSATALNVANTTIGASGLTFQSITSGNNTAAADPANGIVLNTTGSSGGLTVTGTGGAGSGGTIQSCTGVGVSLNSTASVSLTRMNIQGNGDDGINAATVTGFMLTNCTVTNNGNSTTDEGIEFDNLFGSSSITNCIITNNAHNNFYLDNTSGTLSSLTIKNSTFEGHNNGTAFGNHGFLFEANGTALISSVVIDNNCIFRNNFSLGMQVAANSNATISYFEVNDCTFTDTGTGNSQEIAADFAISGAANMTYHFLNNTLTNHNSHGFNTFTGVGSTGSLVGTIQGNVIGDPLNIDSGSKIGNGMRININGNANARIKINSNTLHQIPTGRGIECIARNGIGGANFIVTNNTITAPTGTAGTACGAGVLCPLAPIYVQTNCVTVCNSACSVVSGNTAYDPTSVPGGGGGEFSVSLVETGASALTYEGNIALTALQNLTNANPNCVTKNVSGTVSVVAAGTCITP